MIRPAWCRSSAEEGVSGKDRNSVKYLRRLGWSERDLCGKVGVVDTDIGMAAFVVVIMVFVDWLKEKNGL